MNTTPTDTLVVLSMELQSRNTAEVVIECVIFGFLTLVTVFGNLLTVVAIVRNTKLRTIPNMFVTSLAFSDLGMGVLAMPLSFSVVATSKWLYGPVVCQIQGYVAIIMAAASTQTLAVTAINRYYGIVKCLLYRTYFTRRRSLYLIAMVWTLSCIAPMIYMAAGNRFVWHPGKLFCYTELDVGWYTALLVCVYVGIPVTIILFCYFKVFQTIRERNKRFDKNKTEDAVSTEEIKITRTLFVIVLFFMICWSPVLIVDLVDTFLGKLAAPRAVYLAYTFLVSVSSSVNPVIYGIMSPIFRREFAHSLRLLPCLRSCGEKQTNSTTSESRDVQALKVSQRHGVAAVRSSPSGSIRTLDISDNKDNISVGTVNTRL